MCLRKISWNKIIADSVNTSPPVHTLSSRFYHMKDAPTSAFLRCFTCSNVLIGDSRPLNWVTCCQKEARCPWSGKEGNYRRNWWKGKYSLNETRAAVVWGGNLSLRGQRKEGNIKTSTKIISLTIAIMIPHICCVASDFGVCGLVMLHVIHSVFLTCLNIWTVKHHVNTEVEKQLLWKQTLAEYRAVEMNPYVSEKWIQEF